MKTYPTANIRNVALVGHSGSGKTTLVEALLARSGAIARIGRVEDGTTLSDTEPEEVKRRISLSLAVAPVEWDGCKLNFLDTPGYADFMGEVEAALSVADLAVFVVSAVDGVEVQTEVIWRRCVELGLPRMVFVNKEDKERADFHRVLAQLRDTFGSGFAPLELPIGEEAAFHGVADLLSDQAFAYEADGKHHTDSRTKSIESTTSWSRRSSRATTSSWSATWRARYRPSRSSSAHWPTRSSRAPSSPSWSARP